MHPDFGRYIACAWIAWAVIWLIGALRVKRIVRKQSGASSLLQAGLLGVALCVLFMGKRRLRFLSWRLIPVSLAIGWTGLVLTIAGVALTVLARVYLGGNWSGLATVKQDHTLVRTGPYAFVRHPIYLGVLLASVGSVIALGQLRCVIGFGLIILGNMLKLPLEERLMSEQFGDLYLQYKRETKALIPFVW
ncbi:MAG TPA: isoprenylcysteine carboxylmethyltransferase family protein [Methylomirabilota bacterium]|nr:isoprenylcysteine carboxylmethyltransferase family protein [Methylomirabilota bacterium]